MRPPAPRRSLVALAALVSLGVPMTLQGGACAPQQLTVPVRALERSGRASFVCLGKPGSPNELRPLHDCSILQTTDIDEYLFQDPDAGADAGLQEIPHLYALVTQTTRGEVAVVDTTSQSRSVLDQDPRVPGANFLPVGAQPIDIVSTPGSTATFLGVGEIGHEAIFALPSTRIRPDASRQGASGGGGTNGVGGAGGVSTPPELSDWPVCWLPAAPGRMLLLNDPTRTGLCDGAPEDVGAAHPNGDLSAEGQGRQKLLVTLPDLGGVAVLDAQALLDLPAGSFEPCHMERWVPLEVDLTGVPGNPDSSKFVPRPAGLSYAEGRVYVGDLQAPVVHVLDLPTPCDPVELAPLLPTSLESVLPGEPPRVVTTSHVAVMPSPTPDLKRYLYAVDVNDGSIMTFDVGPGATSRYPLVRPHPEWNPIQPRDRIKYSAPPADLVVVQRDLPVTNPTTGVAQEGVRCNPDPDLPDPIATCLGTNTASCDVSTLYRTSAAYESGAGPLKLRGVFAFAALTNGSIAVIDVDDYDSQCRSPVRHSQLFGCGDDMPSSDALLKTSSEFSCNIVNPNQPRSSTYEAVGQASGGLVPALQSLPQLIGPENNPIELVEGTPFMRATVPLAAPQPDLTASATPFAIGVGSTDAVVLLDPASGRIDDAGSNSLAMNYEDPRAHVIAQEWTVTYEGALPGFAGKLAALEIDGDDLGRLYDPNSAFCDAGTHSQAVIEAMATEQLAALEGKELSDFEQDLLTQLLSPTFAATHADYVLITTELPDVEDAHWFDPARGTCDHATCTAHFGAAATPTDWRELSIRNAYQDQLEVQYRFARSSPPAPSEPANLDELKCCFPAGLDFSVRTGNQWAVVGAISGFFHHVIPGPDGACVDSTDPVLSRMNGRVFDALAIPSGENAEVGVPDGTPLYAFINPMFRFAVLTPIDSNTGVRFPPPQRDTRFRFSTVNAFTPLLISLASDANTLVLPQGILFVPPTGELAVTDGSTNGLIMVSLSSAAVSRSFF